MSEETKKQLMHMRDTVLDAIHTDEVTMRSRYYFIVRSVLWGVGIVLTFGVTLYLISFIAFVFRSNALYALTSLGPKGFATLFISLPWILLLLVFIVFLLLQFLSSHFEFVYRRPLIHTILGSIFILVLGSILIGQSTLHARAYRFSEEHKLPIAGSFYKDAIRENENVYIGAISNYTDTIFTLKARSGIDYTVLITQTTRLPRPDLKEDMTVLVVGEKENNVIKAFGVRPVNKEHVLRPHRDENNLEREEHNREQQSPFHR